MKILIGSVLLSAVVLPVIGTHPAVRIAKQWQGEKEIYQNKGFLNKLFENFLIGAGWKPGEAWCMYFVKAVFMKAFPNNPLIKQLMNGHSITTWNNFYNYLAGRSSSQYVEIVTKPKPGDIVIFQNISNGAKLNTGHGGIVVSAGRSSFYAIEGNSNENGSNEGYMVSIRKRGYTQDLENGLSPLGFIRIKG